MTSFCKGRIASYKIPRILEVRRFLPDDRDREDPEVPHARGCDRRATPRASSGGDDGVIYSSRYDQNAPATEAPMKRREFVVRSAVGSVALGAGHLPFASVNSESTAHAAQAATRKILIAGGGFGTAFIRYMASLTGKARPRICYLPTASADNPYGTVTSVQSCAPLDVEPHVQESFIASTRAAEGLGRGVPVRWTASSARAATPSTSRRSGRRRASTRCCARHGTAASCSAARVRARYAGSRRARPIRARRSCRS